MSNDENDSGLGHLAVSALGIILLGLLGWILLTVHTNSGRITSIEDKIHGHEVQLDRLYQELREHRRDTERKNFGENEPGGSVS